MSDDKYSRMNRPNRIKRKRQSSNRGVGTRANSKSQNYKEVFCDECNGKAKMTLFQVRCFECGVVVDI